MATVVGNPCIRCGKQRIVKKRWQEKVGNSNVTYTETVCPDSECQKKVDEDNQEREEKRQQLADQRAKSKQTRINLTLSHKTNRS
jgi:uncharacterized protein YdbL (DUF1318 family)